MIPEPTAKQCTSHDKLKLPDGQPVMAAWYPSMGGYVARCLVSKDGDCVNVYVWHNGDFPFRGAGSEDVTDYPAPNPMELHHCSAEDFIAFGTLIEQFQNDGD